VTVRSPAASAAATAALRAEADGEAGGAHPAKPIRFRPARRRRSPAAKTSSSLVLIARSTRGAPRPLGDILRRSRASRGIWTMLATGWQKLWDVQGNIDPKTCSASLDVSQLGILNRNNGQRTALFRSRRN